MNDVMIDIETLGTSPASAILSIAAVCFDRATGELGREYYARVSLDGQDGRIFCTDTLRWWAGQKDGAFAEAVSGDKYLISAMEGLTDFLPENVLVWSQGTDFDFSILDHVYDSYDCKTPWAYNAKRDTRTLYDVAELDCKTIPREGTHHNALDDCKHQIRCVVAAFAKLKGIAN